MPRKRAANGHGHIRQRSDGRWEAQILLPPDPGTGHQKRKSIYGYSEEEVAKKLRKLSVAVDEGTHVEPSKLTVGQWMDSWYKDFLGNVKPRTIEQYEMQIRLYIKPHLGAVKLVALGAHTIQAMYNKLLHKDGQKGGISPKSIRNINGVLHSAMEKAITLGYIKTNPTKGCTLPRVVKKEMQAIMDDDVSRFMQAISGHQYEAVYLVDMFTGMRESELVGLQWSCVDFKTGVITVNKQLQKLDGKYVFAPLKNDKQRKVQASNYVMGILRAQQRKQKEWRLRMGALWDNALNLVFTNELGRNLIPGTVYNNFKRIVRGLGMDGVRFHDLRHTFALLSLENGDDIKTVQEALGHATVSFTLDVYGHVSERMKRDSAAKMDARIETILQKKS